MLWNETIEEKFCGAIEKCGSLCVIPIGCIEKQGVSLPCAADYLQAMQVAQAASRLEDVMIFELGAWVGAAALSRASEKTKRAEALGRICIKPDILLLVLEEVCAEIARNGFTKILFINSHRHNAPLINQFLRCREYDAEKKYAPMWTWATDPKVSRPDVLLSEILSRKESFPYITEADTEALKELAECGINAAGREQLRDTGLFLSCQDGAALFGIEENGNSQTESKFSYLADMGVFIAGGSDMNFPARPDSVPYQKLTKNIGDAMTQICAERLAKIFKTLKEDSECLNIYRGINTK